MNNTLFELIGTSKKYKKYGKDDFGPDNPEILEIWFSKKLLLYIEYNTIDNNYFILTPISKISEIGQFEADKIRELLGINPAEEITYYNLYEAEYTNLYNLNQLQKEEHENK